jgi:AraC-like DNA-binding protein
MPSNVLPESGFALLNIMLLSSSIILFVVIALFAVRDARHIAQGQLLALLAVCLASLTVTGLPGIENISKPIYLLARLLGIANIGLLWWFCVSLLRDDFRVDRFAWIGMVAFSIAPLLYFAEYLGVAIPQRNAIETYGSVAPFVMLAHLVWVTLSERNADLVEPRRRARLWLIVAIVVAALISLVSEYLPDPQQASFLRNGLGVLPAQLAVLLWLAELNPAKLEFESLPEPVSDRPKINPRDHALHQNLIRTIESEHIYLRPSLTIDELASILTVPVHHLRQLINAGLGHRNFASFINGYRLSHAKLILGDLDRSRVSILEIAYESGFSSLQSFNRVFKMSEGMTPTDFREKMFAKVTQN